MLEVPLLLILIVVTALVFDYTNGVHDCANAIATIVSTRVASPGLAVAMAASLNLLGALLGTEVARTLGGGLVYPSVVEGCQILVLAALVGAIFWNLFTWYLGIPSSSSHALVGGLVGAALAHAGTQAVNFHGLFMKVVLPFLWAPLLGFCGGFLFMLIIYWTCCRFRRAKVNAAFRHLQFVSSGFLALSHGLNDAQKTMGVVTLALLLFGQIDTMDVPLWVKLPCAVAMCLGTASGGWKIIRTMGSRIFKLEPMHGFAAESATGCTIVFASILGAPVSTTHVISSAIFGVGSSKRVNAVRWGVAWQLVVAWVLTLPCSGLVGALAYWGLSAILP